MTAALCVCGGLSFLLSASLSHPPTPTELQFATLSEVSDHLRVNPLRHNSTRDVINFISAFLLPQTHDQRTNRLKKFKVLYATVKMEICYSGLIAKCDKSEESCNELRNYVNELEKEKRKSVEINAELMLSNSEWKTCCNELRSSVDALQRERRQSVEILADLRLSNSEWKTSCNDLTDKVMKNERSRRGLNAKTRPKSFLGLRETWHSMSGL
jgi:hypothetical protein